MIEFLTLYHFDGCILLLFRFQHLFHLFVLFDDTSQQRFLKIGHLLSHLFQKDTFFAIA